MNVPQLFIPFVYKWLRATMQKETEWIANTLQVDEVRLMVYTKQ
jgi:hypothetical protein